ncbi:hypothetical protein NKH77_00135 [Streptomyces sp. M19]
MPARTPTRSPGRRGGRGSGGPRRPGRGLRLPEPGVIDGLIDRAHAAARAHHRAVMTIVPNLDAARTAERQGAQLILYNMAHVLMDTLRSLAAPGTTGAAENPSDRPGRVRRSAADPPADGRRGPV